MNRIRGILLTIFSACSFGFIPLFAKISFANGFNPYTFSLFRSVFATIELFLLIRIKKDTFSLEKRQYFELIQVSVFGYALAILTLSLSYNYLSTGLATTIHFVYPIVVMFGSIIFYQEKINTNKIFSLLLSITGMFFLMGYGTSGAKSTAGVMLSLISGFFYAYYILSIAHGKIKMVNSFVLIFYVSLFNSITLFFICTLTGKLDFNVTLKGILSTIIVALIANLIGMVTFKSGLKYISASTAAIISTFEPITSLVLGVIVFKEIITLNHFIGSLLIISSVTLIAFRKKVLKVT